MDEQSKNLSGLGSTLASRPQDLYMSLVDNKGNSKALAPLQQFMGNLADLTDFSKPPGSRIQTRFQSSMTKLFGAIFNPLAGATGGSTGEKLINTILDKLDGISNWWTSNSATIITNAKGIWQGLTAAFGMAKPLLDLMGKLSDSGGGDDDPKDSLPGPVKALLDSGLLGKALGFVGGIKAGMAGLDAATFGASSTLVTFAGAQVLGLVNKGLDATKVKILQTSFAMEILTNPLGKMAGLKVALKTFAASAAGGIGGILASIGPIGWVLIAIGAAATALYFKYKPFRQAVDGTWDKVKSGYKKAGDWLGYGWNKFKDGVNGADKSVNGWFSGIADTVTNAFLTIPDKLRSMGKKLYDAILPQWLRDALGKLGVSFSGPPASSAGAPRGRPVAASAGQNAAAAALVGVANRLGIDPNSLLAVAYKESGLNPAAMNKDYTDKNGVFHKGSGASGLIQFLPKTAAEYGLTGAKIRAMTPEQQAPFIERYLRQHGVQPGASLDQIYAAVFGGSATRAGTTLYTKGQPGYDQNIGLDTNKDGQITSGEAAQAAMTAFQGSGITFNQTVIVQGSANPAAVTAIGGATQNGVLLAQANQNAEAGGGVTR